MRTETYDVFVSYARVDCGHAAEIDSALRARGLKTFFDRRNLPPGLPWVRGLEDALNAAKAAIVLIGPHGLGNTQQYERDLAIIRQTREPTFPVVPVLLPEAGISRPFNFLQILTWIDFSHVSEVSDAPAELDHLLAAVRGEEVSPGTSTRETLCPYRGLDAFREADSAFFFGRGNRDDPESAIGQLVSKVREHAFVMVVGRSGSGKSSLVYAGLLPALRRARDSFWNVLSLRPGTEPIEALAIAFNPQAANEGVAKYASRIGTEVNELRTGDPELLSLMIRQELDRSEGKPERLLLYIDQWEELYVHAPSSSADKDRAARHAADVNRFIDLLLNASQSAPVSVVATVRADFYDPLISNQKVRGLLPTRQVLLGLMSRDDLERTIVEPAKLLGLTFDPPTLVSRILDEAGEDDGMLPLLQFALKETWARREGSVMTADSYARSGGVREAIRLTAERTFADLSPADQQAARKLFLRLVTPGEGQEDTRARAAMPDDPALRKIVDQFAGSRTRLLVTDRTIRSEDAVQPTVEVAHEALIRTWPRLRQWVDANRDKLRARAAILQAKAEWVKYGKRADLLLSPGFHLERARLLAADPGDIAIDDVREFVDESVAADDARVAQEHERQAAQLEAANELAATSRRVAQRTLAGLIAALVLALIAIAGGIFAWHERGVATVALDESEKNYQLAITQAAGSVRSLADSYEAGGVSTVLMRDLIEKAQATVAHLPKGGDDVVVAQAKLLGVLTIGNMTLGNIPAARQSADQERALADRLVAQDPANVERRHLWAAARAHSAEVMFWQGDLLNAIELARPAIDAAARLAAANPTNDGLQADLMRLYQNLGDNLRQNGEVEDADKAYHAWLAAAEAESAREPDDPRWQLFLAFGHGRLADDLIIMDKPAEAAKQYAVMAEIGSKLVAREPGNGIHIEAASLGLLRLGDAHLMQGQLTEAETSFRKALADMSTLLEIDPTNYRWRSFVEQAHQRLGQTALRRHYFATADSELATYLKMAEETLRKDRANNWALFNVAEAQLEVGDALREEGNFDQALNRYNQSLALVEELTRRLSTNPPWQKLLAAEHQRLGLVLDAQGNRDAAIAQFRACAAIPVRSTIWSSRLQWPKDVNSYCRNELGRLGG